MLCDVSAIVNTEGAQITLSGSVEANELTPDISVISADVSGRIACTGGVLVLTASVSSQIKTCCARCLSELVLPLNFDFAETLVQSAQEDGEDKESVIIFDGTEIDVGEIVINNLLLNISSKYLCKDNCRGLCPKCGKDLNEGECDCDFVEIDPRWEKLKNFK